VTIENESDQLYDHRGFISMKISSRIEHNDLSPAHNMRNITLM